MNIKKMLFGFYEKLPVAAPYFLDATRMVAAIMFITIGSMALFGFPIAIFPKGGLVLFSWSWFISVLEFFGGILMLVGFLTRPVALLLAIEMVIAYVKVNMQRSWFPVLNGGQTTMLYFFLWVYIFLLGAGPLSIDTLLVKWYKKRQSAKNIINQ